MNYSDQITHALQAKAASTGDQIAELFKGLFPAWPTILATVLAFVVLVTVMYKLVWHPVRKMMKDRSDFIQKNIDESILNYEDAKTQREKAHQMLADHRNEAKDYLEDAKSNAEKVRTKLISDASATANQLIAAAQEEIEAEKIAMHKELRESTIDIALMAAQKVISKEVDNKTNRKLVKDFIDSEMGYK